jgi:hypothetical protein
MYELANPETVFKSLKLINSKELENSISFDSELKLLLERKEIIDELAICTETEKLCLVYSISENKVYKLIKRVRKPQTTYILTSRLDNDDDDDMMMINRDSNLNDFLIVSYIVAKTDTLESFFSLSLDFNKLISI